MRVGSLVYATDQGLGILAKSFYDHGVVTDVLVVRHGRYPTHDEWYPQAAQISNIRDAMQIAVAKAFCETMDVMFFFETPFIWELIPHCKQHGVKTILMPMYECEHVNLPAEPDYIINPSLLDQRYYPRGTFIPAPVEYPWRQRERAGVFIHNGGHGGLKGRNGTAEVIEALKHVTVPAEVWICGQGDWIKSLHVQASLVPANGVNIRFFNDRPYADLYAEGDVFLFPEKFNGLSLPLQEARAAGMLVMCGDRFPMNTWLPRECMIPISGTRQERIGPPYNVFDEAIYDPKAIAKTIDDWYNVDISAYSQEGRRWARYNSWDVLKPVYTEFLESCV